MRGWRSHINGERINPLAKRSVIIQTSFCQAINAVRATNPPPARSPRKWPRSAMDVRRYRLRWHQPLDGRSEEHTSELQSLMRISYAVFCLKKKNNNT